MAIITTCTKEILESVTDDFRTEMIKEVLFSKEFTGNGRSFKTMSSDEIVTLREAKPGDILNYSFIGGENYSDTIRQNIEQNLTHINKMRDINKTPMGISNIWIILFENDEEIDNITTNVYLNPQQEDRKEILTNKKQVVMACFAIAYNDGTPEPKVFDNCIEWTFLSPGDNTKLSEYNEYLKKKEIEALSDVFTLDIKSYMDKK